MKIKVFLTILFISLINISICQNNEECSELNCNLENGNCTEYDDNKGHYFCNCHSGYTTYPYDNKIQCNYKQKSQLKAFLLELFLCYGAGHFYIHNYKLAIPKLIVFAFFYYLFIGLRIITKAKEENKFANLIICIGAGVTFLGLLVWQIVDLVFFGRNKYHDGNDIPLLNW